MITHLRRGVAALGVLAFIACGTSEPAASAPAEFAVDNDSDPSSVNAGRGRSGGTVDGVKIESGAGDAANSAGADAADGAASDASFAMPALDGSIDASVPFSSFADAGLIFFDAGKLTPGLVDGGAADASSSDASSSDAGSSDAGSSDASPSPNG